MNEKKQFAIFLSSSFLFLFVLLFIPSFIARRRRTYRLSPFYIFKPTNKFKNGSHMDFDLCAFALLCGAEYFYLLEMVARQTQCRIWDLANIGICTVDDEVKSSETNEPLAVYSTTRPIQKQKWSERNDEVTNGTEQELVEIRISFNENGHPHKFHTILAFNGTNEGEGGLLETQRIFIMEERMPADLEGIGWRNLHSLIRPCIKLERPMEKENEGGNGTSKGSDFYVQLANVTLSQLDQTIGRAEAMGTVAQSLAIAANISQLRIVDLELKEMATGTGNGNDNILVALFSIGRPVEGIKPAKTAYLKKEISVQEAAAALNSTIRANQFKVRIPMEQTKKDWNISGSIFGTQSSLFPSWPPAPIPTPSPKPSPPSFVGYSGSALAICSIFAFVLGAILCIGGYIFYQKRQHIRGMAYQVFE